MKKCCHMSQHLSIQNTISGSYHEKRGKMFIFVWVLCIFARHFYEQCICMKIFWFQGLKLCNCWCESIQTWKLNKNIYDSEIWQNMSFNDFPFLLHILMQGFRRLFICMEYFFHLATWIWKNKFFIRIDYVRRICQYIIVSLIFFFFLFIQQIVKAVAMSFTIKLIEIMCHNHIIKMSILNILSTTG